LHIFTGKTTIFVK